MENQVKLGINIEAIQAAADNSTSFADVALPIPVVDPAKLTIGCQIFKITENDITPKAKVEKDGIIPGTLGKYLAIEAINVDNLSGTITPDCITVNGQFDIPRKSGRVVNLDGAFFVEQADARAVCKILTVSQIARVSKIKEYIGKEYDFLTKQDSEDRY